MRLLDTLNPTPIDSSRRVLGFSKITISINVKEDILREKLNGGLRGFQSAVCIMMMMWFCADRTLLAHASKNIQGRLQITFERGRIKIMNDGWAELEPVRYNCLRCCDITDRSVKQLYSMV